MEYPGESRDLAGLSTGEAPWKDLFQQARQGSRAAQEQLFGALYSSVLCSVASELPPSLRQWVEDQDVVQEVLLRVLTHLGQFEYRSPNLVRRWLRQILVREIRSLYTYFKAAKRTPRYIPPFEARQLGATVLHSPGTSGESAAQTASREEYSRLALQEIHQLPHPYGEIVRIVLLESGSQAEAGRVLGLDESTVRHHLARALRILAVRLSPFRG